MEAAATALTTLPLSTRILMTELAIFVKVEKMEVRIVLGCKARKALQIFVQNNDYSGRC